MSLAAAKLRALSTISRELIALRRGDHSAARLLMEQVRFDKERAAEVEQDRLELKKVLASHFQSWLQEPEIRKLMENGRSTDAERIAAMQRRVYGDAAAMIVSTPERETSLAVRAIDGDGI